MKKDAPKYHEAYDEPPSVLIGILALYAFGVATGLGISFIIYTFLL